MFWDIGSTNAYFALHLIKPILKRTNSELTLHPYNLGFAFRSRNYVLMEEPAIKIENRKVDLARWAKKYNLNFRFPSEFPIKTSRTLRGALAMREFNLETPFIEAIFCEYWENNNSTIQTNLLTKIIPSYLSGQNRWNTKYKHKNKNTIFIFRFFHNLN